MARKRRLPSGIWLRGIVYYARFRAGGRLIRKRLSTDLRAATEILNDLKAKADKADFGIVDNDYSWEMLKAKFLTWARQSVRNPQEYASDLAMFERFYRPRSVREIDQQLVIGYRDWRLSMKRWALRNEQRRDGNGQSITPRTVNREVGTVFNMFNKGVEWKCIGLNPLAGLKPLRHDMVVKERRALSVDEVNQILAASPDWLRPVWRMLLTTGIRKGELIGLQFRDVDFGRRTVTIRASVSKSHKAREIPLDDEMFRIIAEHRDKAKYRQPVAGDTPERTERQRQKFTREHVFVSKANTPLDNNLLHRFYTVCRRAGIDGAHRGGSVDLHSLRVTFATQALEHGANPKAVQALLGHSTLALTMNIYGKATERSKREAIAGLPFAASITGPDHVIPVASAHKARTSRQERLTGTHAN
jgi:integrase